MFPPVHGSSGLARKGAALRQSLIPRRRRAELVLEVDEGAVRLDIFDKPHRCVRRELEASLKGDRDQVHSRTLRARSPFMRLSLGGLTLRTLPVQLMDAPREGAGLPVADADAVELDDWRDLQDARREEDLAGFEERHPRDRSLDGS